MTRKNILIVEDERLVANDIERQLAQLGYHVSGIANSAVNAYQCAAVVRPDLVLMDIHIKGDVDGIQAAKHLSGEHNVPVVFLTAHADQETLRLAVEAEPYGYVIKPFNARALAATVETALYRREVENRMMQSGRWMAMTLQSIGEGIIATDRSSRVIFMNPAAEELTGWTAAEATGLSLMDVFKVKNDATQDVIDLLGRLYSQIVVVSINEKLSLIRRDGSSLAIDGSFTAIREASQKMVGAVAVFRSQERHAA